jgi:hypothetical protein
MASLTSRAGYIPPTRCGSWLLAANARHGSIPMGSSSVVSMTSAARLFQFALAEWLRSGLQSLYTVRFR